MKYRKQYKKGDKFNHLVFITDVEPLKKGGSFRRHSIFKCVCGNTSTKITSSVTAGKTKSCGKCSLSYIIPDNHGNKNGSYSHGMFGTRFFNIYHTMRARCQNLNNRYYGGKGVKNEWSSFLSFKEDMFNSYLIHVNEYGEKQTTIDRINSNKNYCKENCRWATYKEQKAKH